MKRWVVCWGQLVAALLLMGGVGALQAEARDPLKYFFQESFGDLSEEMAMAREEGKQGVLVFFEMDECPFCHYMKQNVLNQREVQEYYREHFRLIMVDIEGDVELTDFQGNVTTQKEFANQNKVRATPMTAFFDLEGNRVHRFTGKSSGAEEFLLMGRFVAEGHYKTQKFTRYKRQLRDGV